jgi:hypothetical protein
MLKQPMIEKLAAMRLLGMADALKAQEQDPSARELSFLEAIRPVSGSAVELAGEPGALTTPKKCEAAYAERLR